MLKVVHVVEALAGGVNTYFKDLSWFFDNEKAQHDIHTTIIYSSNRKEVDADQIKATFSKAVVLKELSMVREFKLIADYKAVVELINFLRISNPDIVHLHSSKAGVLGRIACAFLSKKVKVFYSPHGYAFLRTDISPIRKKIYKGIEVAFQKLFKSTTITCGDTEQEIAKKIGPSFLVRNGIDVEQIQQHKIEHINATLTIGIVGRITAARNPVFFNSIALQNPHCNFVWIGDGELKNCLTATNISITGWFLDQKKALKELNKIDVYIQTSLWEGLPIAVLEAMALQKPVLATNIIGNKDVVVPDETGYLFETVAEANHFLEILQDEKTRKILGENGLNRCKELFSNERKFKELIALYHG